MRFGQLTRVGNGFFGESFDWGGLVALIIDELVVYNLNIGIVGWQKGNLIGDGLGICERGDILSDTSEAQDDVLAVRSAQLCLALLAQHDDIGIWLLNEHPANLFAQTRVDTTTETFVGAGNNNQVLLVITLNRLRLGLFEDFVGGLSVLSGVGHRTLSSSELGGSNDLHGLGDLLDIANRLQSVLDFTKGRESGCILNSRPIQASNQYHLLQALSVFVLSFAEAPSHPQHQGVGSRTEQIPQLSKLGAQQLERAS